MSSPIGAPETLPDAGPPAVGTVLDVDGLATYVADQGEGPTVLLVHGSGPGIDGHFSWDPIAPTLAQRFRVLTVDMPGYGRSDFLRDADTPANVALHLVRLLDHLGIDRAAAIGHSRGGRISSELALAAPDRVSHLAVLTSGSTAPRGHLDDEGNFTASALALVRFGQDGDTSLATFKAAIRTMVVYPHAMPDAVLDDLYERFVSSGSLERYVDRMRAFDPLAFYHAQSAAEFEQQLTTLRMPVTVVWGKEDETSSYHRAVGLVDLVPDLELHILPRCAHFVQYDRPRSLVELLVPFLERPAP